MALKRKRPTVSYKEPSTDDDASGDCGSEADYSPKQAAASSRPQRRSARHSAQERPEASSPLRQGHTYKQPPTVSREADRPRRQRNRMVSYRESSPAENSDTWFEDDEAPPVRETSNNKTGGRPQRSQKKAPAAGRSNRVLGAPLKRKSTPKSTTPAPLIPSDGNIPQWSSLPYQILLQIFLYASRPLHDENLIPTPAISWLAQTARVCSSFTTPALTALYRNPPIFAIKQKRKDLVHRLLPSASEGHENYLVMPKRLALDATKMSHLTDPAHSTSDLVSLIMSLKTLKEIDIFDPYDRPPYRPRSKTTRGWRYPSELFDALQQSEVRLNSWRWNTAFLTHGFLWMKQIHAEEAFQNLRELTFTKFSPDVTHQDNEKAPTKEELFALTLEGLPRLKTINFETCTIVNGNLLPLLPKTLVNLNLTNCEELTSDALEAYLLSHGSHLEELVLNHNRSLEISFLVSLKPACPGLKVLRMDLNYYSSLALSNDSDPNYDELLKEGEIPSWPSTLSIIDLEYLRKWTPAAAKGFFRSLIDSADRLPYLRELRILAMVDIDWRERAAFRSEWTARFQHVFLRKAPPPSEHLASLRAFREWKTAQFALEEKNDSFMEMDHKEEIEDEANNIPLNPSRATEHVPKPRSNDKWSSKRLRTRARPSSSGGESAPDYIDSPIADCEGIAVQGRCEVVVFRIDNFRPREEIFGENDFLDSEVSGDEDWDGNDYVVEGYAW